MQVIVDKLLVRYEVQGSGKTLVLLHGWASSLSTFSGISRQLAKQYRVICLDLPGFGNSQVPDDAWGINEYAAFVGTFLRKIDETDVYALVGHSNGGAIAIAGLARGYLNSKKLVLLASAGIRGNNKSRSNSFKLLAKTGKVLVKPLPQSTQKRLRIKLYKSVGSDMLIAENLTETFKKVVNDDVRADASKLDIPVLLVYGEKDKETPVLFGETYHQLINNSTLAILPAGHFVFLDRPGDVLKLMERFLA